MSIEATIRESDKPLKILGTALSNKLQAATAARRRLAEHGTHVVTQDLHVGTTHRPVLAVDAVSDALRADLTSVLRSAPQRGRCDCTARFGGCELTWQEDVKPVPHTNVRTLASGKRA